MNAEPSSPGAGRLVTIFGGAGYIGPIVAKRLLRQGYRVRIVDMFLYGTQNVLLGLFDEPGLEVLGLGPGPRVPKGLAARPKRPGAQGASESGPESAS